MLFYCKWRTNDDVIIKSIVAGRYGNTDYHLIYINTIIGRILKTLYDISENFPWYELLQYVLLVYSLSLLTNILLNKNNMPWLDLILVLIISYQAYTRPQYSVTASVLTSVAIVSLEYSLKDKSNKFYLISGFILLGFGICFRLKQFLACAAITAFVFIPDIIEYFKSIKEKKYIKNKKMNIVLLVSVLILAVTCVVNTHDYKSDGWKTFNEYNDYRTDLIDGGYPKYSEYENEYNNIGINEDAFYLYSNWNFDDPNIMTVDKMKEILSFRKPKIIDSNLLYTFAITTVDYSFRDSEILIFTLLILLVFVVLLATNKFNKINLIQVIFMVMFTIVSMLYVFYQRNTHINRLTIGYYSSLAISILYLINNTRNNISKESAIIISVILLITFIYFAIPNLKNNSETKINNDNNIKEAISIINEDSNHLYICKVSSCLINYDILFDRDDDHSSSNITSLGRWDTKSPLKQNILKRFGINNPYADLIDNPNVYLLDDDIERTINYIKKYYDANAKYIFEGCINGYNRYSIISN